MSHIIRYGGGGKGGGGETHIDYHWLFSIAELKVIQDPTISFKTTLGNIVFIGDGVSNKFYIPNAWERLYYFQGGYGIETFYPPNIKLYLNSINNLLVENTDYTYDSNTGLVTLNFTPKKNDLIAMTATYDPENPRETTFYASFAFEELFKRIGFKYYKINEDYYNTLIKLSRASRSILNNIWIPMMSGKIDIVYNPLVSLGQTIHVKDPKTGFDNIVFIKGFDKTLGDSPSLTLDILNYPSMVEINNFRESNVGVKFSPNLPTLGVSFIDETDDDSDYYGDGLFFRAEVLDYFGSKFNIFKNPVKISLVLNNKVRVFPSSENNINNYYSKNTRGILSMYYTASFRKSTNGEYTDDSDLQNDFPEFFDSENPKLFVNKTIQLILEDLKSGAKTTQAIYVTFGYKRPFRGYFVPCYPYEPFVTFGGNGEYIYIVDKSKRLWAVSNLLNSVYIDTLDFLDENSFCIISSGKNIFIVDNGAENVKKYDVESKTYKTYTINDCLCVKPDTLVYGKGCVKPIKDFKAGEKVLTHTGRYCKINKVLTRFYKGDLIKIKIYNGENITTTPEHPILTIEGWKEAKDIKAGDKIIEVFDNKVEDKEYIYLTDFLDQKILEKIKYDKDYIYLPNFNLTNIKKVKNKIKIDKYFLKLVGLYLSEGSIGYRKKGQNIPFDKNGVNFYFGNTKKEKKLAEHTRWLIRKVFKCDSRIWDTSTGVMVGLGSTILANFFNLFGTKSENKKILDWIMYLPPKKQKALILGFLKGDGNIRRFKTKIRFNQCGKYYKQCEMKTVSLQLAYQLRTLLKRINIVSGISIRKEGYYKIFKRKKEVFCRRQYIIGWSKKAVKNTIKNNFYIREVREISKEYYEGLVYNFNVAEDNSYTIAGATVHNCGCNVYLNHKHIYDENSNPLFYFRGYSNTTDVPYVSYVNFIKYKEFEDTMVKTKWKFTISDKVFAGIPFVYKNILYFGRIGFNLKNACSYEGEHNWTSEADCSLIVDNSNLVFKDDFSLNKIKAIYMSDLLENSLWVIGSDCSSADDYHLTQPRVIGKEIIIGKRKDNIYDSPFDPSKDSEHWVKIAKFTSSTDDIENWDIMPLALYGNKLLVLVKGKEPSRIIKDFNFGLAVFDESDKKLHFKIIKYYGDSIKGTQLEQQLSHTIRFRDKILYNWKDYSYILNLDDIYTISGE